MNNNLKTLKELIHKVELDYLDDNEKIATYEAIEVDKLRAEAIKWIKDLNKENKSEINDIDKSYFLQGFLGCGCCDSNNLVIYWIKHFFNITEEELK